MSVLVNELRKLLPSCATCRDIAFVRTEWDDGADGSDWYCIDCFRTKYVCSKPECQKRILRRDYFRPNMCVHCDESQ